MVYRENYDLHYKGVTSKEQLAELENLAEKLLKNYNFVTEGTVKPALVINNDPNLMLDRPIVGDVEITPYSGTRITEICASPSNDDLVGKVFRALPNVLVMDVEGTKYTIHYENK